MDSGFTILKSGGGSTSAVKLAIRVTESSPLFNAGLGSVLNEEGIIEMVPQLWKEEREELLRRKWLDEL